MVRAQRILGVDPHRLAVRLRAARRAKDWTRLRLAQTAQVAPSTVGNLEQEKSESPDPLVVLALALALGFESVAELLGDDPAPPWPPATPGPGPMSLDRLVESLLRGVWAAQDARPAAGPAGEEVAVPTVQEVLRRAAEAQREASGGMVLNLNLVMLVEPRTLG